MGSTIHVRKVQRQGGQHVINIPRAVMHKLSLSRGSLVGFLELQDNAAVILNWGADRLAEITGQELMHYGLQGVDKGFKGVDRSGFDKSGRINSGGTGGGDQGVEGGDSGAGEGDADRASGGDGGDKEGIGEGSSSADGGS